MSCFLKLQVQSYCLPHLICRSQTFLMIWWAYAKQPMLPDILSYYLNIAFLNILWWIVIKCLKVRQSERHFQIRKVYSDVGFLSLWTKWRTLSCTFKIEMAHDSKRWLLHHLLLLFHLDKMYWKYDRWFNPKFYFEYVLTYKARNTKY